MLIFNELYFCHVLNHFGYSQSKKFDYSTLSEKTLYIPTYEASTKFIKKMGKKGKYDKISEAKNLAEYYNKIWKEAMAESSFDAVNYEIRSFDRKKLIKTKNKEAILLMYRYDEYGNASVMLRVTYPKSIMIASAIITGLDLSEKNDIRLMMNMLAYSLNTIAESAGENNGYNRNQAVSKYKKQFVDYYFSMKDKTFLVPKSEHKNPKKAKQRTLDLEAALKNWKLSNYELTSYDAIEEKRIEGDSEYYYWKNFKIYTKQFSYNYNMILSTDGDKVLFGFMGKKRLKPTTLDVIQDKLARKANKYKKQLEK